MNTISLYAAFGSSALTDQNDHQERLVTRLELCRSIVDELLDRDLMGFLLSPRHLRKFLAHYSFYAPAPIASQIRRCILNAEITDELHIFILKKFKGLHIPETSIPSSDELKSTLDRKYETFAQEVNTGDVRYEVSLQEHKNIENERRYRHACERVKTITCPIAGGAL